MSFAISWLCWNSAQSILITARGFLSKASAAAATIRVLPDPVGPRNRKLPIRRPGALIPVRVILIAVDDLPLDRLVLTDDHPAQVAFGAETAPHPVFAGSKRGC